MNTVCDDIYSRLDLNTLSYGLLWAMAAFSISLLVLNETCGKTIFLKGEINDD